MTIFETTYYGNTILEWFIALSLIVGSIIISRIVYWLFNRWFRVLAKRTKTTLDDVILKTLNAPVAVTIIIVGFWLSFNTLTMIPSLRMLLNRAFYFTIALTVVWFITRLYDIVHKVYLVPLARKSTSDFNDQLIHVIRLGVRVVAWSLGIIIGLNNAGYDVGAVVAGLGLGGLAFALAAQDSLANVFGGVTVIIQQPFRVGDHIEVAGVDGWVIDIGLRSSTIEDFGGQQTVVPNRIFTDNPVHNIDTRPAYYIDQQLRLRFDTTPEKIDLAINLLKQIAVENPLIEDRAWVSFDEISDYSLNLKFRYGIKLWQIGDAVYEINDWYQKIGLGKTQINMEILRQFEANNLKLALPVEIESHPPENLGKSLFY
ncbi:MAG: mechanosensitive ion channel family protein [Chloroflexota bacterium]